MVFLILTKQGFNDIKTIAKEINAPIWMGEGVLNGKDLEYYRGEENMDISNFIYYIDSQEDILCAISSIEEHHPRQTIWIENLNSLFLDNKG